jgi:hypothetical protein
MTHYSQTNWELEEINVRRWSVWTSLPVGVDHQGILHITQIIVIGSTDSTVGYIQSPCTVRTQCLFEDSKLIY